MLFYCGFCCLMLVLLVCFGIWFGLVVLFRLVWVVVLLVGCAFGLWLICCVCNCLSCRCCGLLRRDLVDVGVGC